MYMLYEASIEVSKERLFLFFIMMQIFPAAETSLQTSLS